MCLYIYRCVIYLCFLLFISSSAVVSTSRLPSLTSTAHPDHTNNRGITCWLLRHKHCIVISGPSTPFFFIASRWPHCARAAIARPIRTDSCSHSLAPMKPPKITRLAAKQSSSQLPSLLTTEKFSLSRNQKRTIQKKNKNNSLSISSIAQATIQNPTQETSNEDANYEYNNSTSSTSSLSSTSTIHSKVNKIRKPRIPSIFINTVPNHP